MWANRWLMLGINTLLSIFTIYLFFFYFDIFFRRRRKNILTIIGFAALVIWQLNVSDIIYTLPAIVNICITIGITIFSVTNIFEGNFWKKSFFTISFDAIWMLMETLSGYILMIYCERYTGLQPLGSFVSKIFFFVVIIALKKVFTNDEVRELPIRYGILLILIPMGSIYIMNAIFMLDYRVDWDYANVYSIIPIIILLGMNVLIFYVYIKLADDLQVRRMNSVYEKQLELCERHQEETEASILQIRDVRHNMKNNFISILAYAENGDCEKIIHFVNDVMDDGRLKISAITNSGNIVIDSLIGYWYMTAKNEGIEFYVNLCIPMQMPFRGADISLILGNLLENAVEAARKVEDGKYIRLSMKYDKNNLLLCVENNYKDTLIKTKDKILKSTKMDAANHGIGLRSVYRIAEKYHGIVTINDSVPNRFLVRMILYGN